MENEQDHLKSAEDIGHEIGEHNIQVAVIDEEGNQLGISEGIRVFVFRPSTNDRSRNRPPRPTPRVRGTTSPDRPGAGSRRATGGHR